MPNLLLLMKPLWQCPIRRCPCPTAWISSAPKCFLACWMPCALRLARTIPNACRSWMGQLPATITSLAFADEPTHPNQRPSATSPPRRERSRYGGKRGSAPAAARRWNGLWDMPLAMKNQSPRFTSPPRVGGSIPLPSEPPPECRSPFTIPTPFLLCAPHGGSNKSRLRDPPGEVGGLTPQEWGARDAAQEDISRWLKGPAVRR
jgi:hypothetical protein